MIARRAARGRALAASAIRSRATRRRRRSRCAGSRRCSSRPRDATTEAYGRLRETWFEQLLGPERDELPTNAHVHYLRRLSPLESTYTKERSVDVCMASVQALGFDMTAIPNIRLDLEDRPQKNPRACVIASDPPDVVHLITRAQGGLADYQAFMHEAGHALHYAGVDPRLPYTFRSDLARPRADRDLLVHLRGDHARAGLARAALRPLGRAGAGERAGDALPRGAALPPLHGEAALRARLLVELRGGAGQLAARLRDAADGGDRHPLRPARLRRRHGLRLLLRRLSARVDPLGAAARLPDRARSARTGGGARRPATSCATCSPRARGRRARRSPPGSASTRSTPRRSSPSSPRPSPGRSSSSAARGSRASASATCSVSSLSCCVSAVFASSSSTIRSFCLCRHLLELRVPLVDHVAVHLVAVGLARLREQDQRRGVGGLRREDEVEQDERVRVPVVDQRHRVEDDPERSRRPSGRGCISACRRSARPSRRCGRRGRRRTRRAMHVVIASEARRRPG